VIGSLPTLHRHNIRLDTTRVLPDRPKITRSGISGLDDVARDGDPDERVSARASDAATPATDSTRGDPIGESGEDRAGTEAFDGRSAATARQAAEVACAVAELVSAATDATAQQETSFAALARRLQELEARLHQVGRTDDAVAVKRALSRIETQFQEMNELRPQSPPKSSDAATPAAQGVREPTVHDRRPTDAPRDERNPSFAAAGGQPPTPSETNDDTSGSSGSFRGSRRARRPGDHAAGAELDAHIRNLTLRMAAAHKDALRRDALEAQKETSSGEAPLGTEPSVDRTEPHGSRYAGARLGTRATAFDPSAPSRAMADMLGRYESKIDDLVSKAQHAAEAAAADRHQADLLARRIESAELQIAKRLNAGFATASVESRVVEDMLRALVARSEALNDLGGSLTRLEMSVTTIRERLDRIETRVGTTIPSTTTRESALDDDVAANAAGGNPTRQVVQSTPRSGWSETDSKVGASLDAIQDAIARITDSLKGIEAHLASANPRPRCTAEPKGLRSAVLPWLDGQTKRAQDTAKDRPPSRHWAIGQTEHKAGRFDADREAEPEILIEPGSGFTPPLEFKGPRPGPDPGLDTDEGVNGPVDFIEAARRAMRTARGNALSDPADEAPEPPEPRKNLAAMARRIARAVRERIVPY
jgi:phage shock protein A